MQHGNHKFNTAFEMAMATICAFSPSKYTLPHWKCVFLCCVKYPHIDLPVQNQTSIISMLVQQYVSMRTT